jgi:hypothetical protein
MIALTLLATACEDRPGGADDAGPQTYVAGPPVECSAPPAFDSSLGASTILTTGDHALLLATQTNSGLARFEFEGGEFVEFSEAAGVAPWLPSPTAAAIYGFAETCFGEGCDYGSFEIMIDDAETLLLVGELSFTGNTERSYPHFQFADAFSAPAPSDATCPSGSGPAVAALTISTDEGPVLLLPSHERAVTIDGVLWAARAGTARRTEFAQNTTDCADCPPPGVHATTKMQVLIYRGAEPE